MILQDVVNKKLPGWQLLYGYFMERKHGLMGCFPALRAGTEKAIVCLDRGDLQKIWSKLPRKEVKVSRILLYVNKEENMAIPVNSLPADQADSEDYFLIQGDEIETYLQKADYFSWSPGSLSLNDESGATFPKE